MYPSATEIQRIEKKEYLSAFGTDNNETLKRIRRPIKKLNPINKKEATPNQR